MTALRRLRTITVAAVALTVPAALLVGSQAEALPQAPGASVPASLPSKGTVGGVSVENSFVSHVGWVKPGEAYVSRFLAKNTTTTAKSVSVRLPETRGMRWTAAKPTQGTAGLAGGVVTWKLPSLGGNGNAILVLEAKAATVAQEPTVVWRNVSSRGTVTVGSASGVFASHGPKVIPSTGGFETARYGDRPFPVVPVDYADFTHTRSSAKLDNVINNPSNPASTYSLYQEMSYGQLFPHGTIPSVALKDRVYTADPEPLRFTTIDPTTISTCIGVTSVNPTNGEPLATYTNRIRDGWYQLPGTRGYYGSDGNGSAIVGSLAGVSALQSIDSGCGPAAKTAYDAAVVADPDIDYNDFDTDKDGVVDFFEVIFQGCGGNGESQLSLAGGCDEISNDNVWPHSSSLENSYVDATTGLSGYISKDQLKDIEGRPLWYTDTTYTTKTTANKGDALKVYVRVGPYNVNPENSIDYASVISHEYGHSLGLPDYYSTGSRGTYGDFTLMATDHSQNMDIIGKKELGWVVPDVLPKGVTKVKGWHDTKRDTGTIHWRTKAGKPYTLSAKNGDFGIHNGQAYQVALPGRQLLDPALITAKGGKQVWYSQQGNDFGCPPVGGHNLDFVIPGLDKLPAGTTVKATFKTLYEIEWDYDYGFVLSGKPDAKGKYTYASNPSESGQTTTQNANQNACQAKYSNGITGSGSSNTAGTAVLDRVAGTYGTRTFVDDSYDISDLAGVKGGVLRFTYATDPGLAKLGWIVDDLKVTATVNGAPRVLYSSDFENGKGGPNDPAVYPGGCKEDASVDGGLCTEGWSYLTAGTPSSQEHAYLLEMRDRSGFDFNGRGQDNRTALAFQPGVLLTYTDESHGYGNVGTDNPPAQSPLDAKPQPLEDDPDLSDATFTEARASYTDSKRTPHLDNYGQPTVAADKSTAAEVPWKFAYDCLKLHVDALSGEADNATSKYDLVGDVTFTTAGGCARFNYGFAAESAVAPAIGGPGLPADQPVARPGTRPGAGGGNLPATGGLGAPALAVLALLGAGYVARCTRLE